MGDVFTITVEDVEGTASLCSTTHKALPGDVNVGDPLLIDDGRVAQRGREADGGLVPGRARPLAVDTEGRVATRQVGVQPPMTLSNRGGIITLLDSRGVKVHGVSYTRGQAAQPGRT